MRKCITIFLFTVSFTHSLFSAQGSFAQVKDAHTQVQLLSEVTSVQPGVPFTVAVHFKMDEGWHTYWQNPGDSGLATTIKWDLPPGMLVGPIQWPYPKTLAMSSLMTYGYEGEVLLFTEMTVPESFPTEQNLELKARVNWLACEVICIPGKADLNLTIPVKKESPKKDKRWESAFAQTRNKLAQPSDWVMQAVEQNQEYALRFKPTDGEIKGSLKAQFFPKRDDLINHIAPQKITRQGDTYELLLEKSALKLEEVKSLEGILVYWTKGSKSHAKKAVLVNALISQNELAHQIVSVQNGHDNLFFAIIFAFIGGLILNLMPCVLPVLSLKVLSLIKHASESRLKTWHHGLIYSLGILVSFWILAGVMLLLKALGQQIGWGFQFQSPMFVVILSIVFFVFSLNLFGVFEIGASLTRFAGVQQPAGWMGSFTTGVLATIAATPCTAPFMGSAIGIAMTKPPSYALTIFTFLGLGMAAPYLFLSRFPGLLRFVPKPGPWMNYLKRFMGLLLLLTVVWLCWVLNMQQGTQTVAILVLGLFVLGFGIRKVGMVEHGQLKFKARVFSMGIFFLGLVICLLSVQMESTSKPVSAKGVSTDPAQIAWQEYSPQLVESLLKANEPVFIDFTAAWCLSCQVNDRLVFQSKNVIAKFKEKGIVPIKADWTNRDEVVTKALAGYGKNSIPLYVLYGKGANKEPVILPEIVTPGIVVEALNKLENM